MNKIELRLDVIFEKDINIGEVSKLLGKEPGFVLEKGKKYFFKEEKVFDFSLCDFRFEGKSDGFSEFVVEKFAPIEKNLRALAEFTEENGGRIELTAYFEKKPKPSDLSVHGKAKALLFPLNPDIYFSF